MKNTAAVAVVSMLLGAAMVSGRGEPEATPTAPADITAEQFWNAHQAAKSRDDRWKPAKTKSGMLMQNMDYLPTVLKEAQAVTAPVIGIPMSQSGHALLVDANGFAYVVSSSGDAVPVRVPYMLKGPRIFNFKLGAPSEIYSQEEIDRAPLQVQTP